MVASRRHAATGWILLVALLLALAADVSLASSAPPTIEGLLQLLRLDSKRPTLWKQLGKLQLDAGEFAEACRIFCYGSECCPNDEGLRHHAQVFQTFHGTDNDPADDTTESSTTAKSPPPELELPPTLELLSMDVPPSAIPDAIRDYPQGMSSGPRTRLVHATQHPIIPAATCRQLIQSAIDTTNRIGWTTNRHVHAPTCDVPVFDLDRPIREWVRRSFHNVLFPYLSQVVSPEVQIEPNEWRVQDCFIVRYDGDNDDAQQKQQQPGFSSLRPHQDESLWSLTIALNDMDVDYHDGGLFLACTQDVLNGPAGTVLCFAGGLTHGGYPVSKGTRWILTVFLYVDRNLSGKPPGYTLEALGYHHMQ